MLLSITALAQNQRPTTYLYDLKNFWADSSGSFKPCKPQYISEYFALNCKYPVSSAKLLERVQQFYQKPTGNTQTGFITFRFLVNCEGKTGWYQVFQTDSQYQTYTFDPAIVAQLKKFVEQLDQWKPGKWESDTFNYFAYFTFKINAGNVENLIP